MTGQLTFDNLSLTQVLAPAGSFIRSFEIRELASDASPSTYNVSEPGPLNTPFPKYAAESHVIGDSAGPVIANEGAPLLCIESTGAGSIVMSYRTS